MLIVSNSNNNHKDLARRTSDWEALARQAGGPTLAQKVLEKSERLFNQKTKPIHFHNQASIPLKVCLFSEDDKFCAVPVGGVGGSCVIILDPTLRCQLRPPGSAERFQVKVLAPGLIERKLYMANVWRGSPALSRSVALPLFRPCSLRVCSDGVWISSALCYALCCWLR